MACSGNDAQKCAERLFNFLGWQVSMKDSKRMPMSKKFDSLGDTFAFQQSQHGESSVRTYHANLFHWMKF